MAGILQAVRERSAVHSLKLSLHLTLKCDWTSTRESHERLNEPLPPPGGGETPATYMVNNTARYCFF